MKDNRFTFILMTLAVLGAMALRVWIAPPTPGATASLPLHLGPFAHREIVVCVNSVCARRGIYSVDALRVQVLGCVACLEPLRALPLIPYELDHAQVEFKNYIHAGEFAPIARVVQIQSRQLNPSGISATSYLHDSGFVRVSRADNIQRSTWLGRGIHARLDILEQQYASPAPGTEIDRIFTASWYGSGVHATPSLSRYLMNSIWLRLRNGVAPVTQHTVVWIGIGDDSSLERDRLLHVVDMLSKQ